MLKFRMIWKFALQISIDHIMDAYNMLTIVIHKIIIS